MARRRHNVTAIPQRRRKPDVPRLSRLLIELARADAERAAQAEHEARKERSS